MFPNYQRKPRNKDVNLGNLLSLKVMEYGSVSVFLPLIYDGVLITLDRDGK